MCCRRQRAAVVVPTACLTIICVRFGGQQHHRDRTTYDMFASAHVKYGFMFIITQCISCDNTPDSGQIVVLYNSRSLSRKHN